MSWITLIWSAVSGASLMMALMHLLVWFRDRRSWEHLCFSVVVLNVIGMAAGEVGMMRAESPEEFEQVSRWIHAVYGVAVAASLGFVHFYFRTGSRGLMALALGLRGIVMVANFTTGVNLHTTEVHSLETMMFLGEKVSILGEWEPNPWMRLGQLATIAQLAYCGDAALRLWRDGEKELRRRAVVIGISLAIFFIVASAQAGLVASGVLRMPFVVSMPFLIMVLAMGHELSRDVLRAAHLARDLSENQKRMTLAAEAAHLGLWIRDMERNEIWASVQWRALFGFPAGTRLTLDDILGRVHPDDREPLRKTLNEAVAMRSTYGIHYRVAPADGGPLRWIASRGRVECDAEGRPVVSRGVSMDVTERKRVEEELEQQRRELAHLSRATMLSALSGSLAHELNQPLGIILSNAQAAEALLERDPPDLAEVRSILADIVKADHRAGEVIKRLRAFLKRGEINRQAHDLNDIVEDVLQLARSDLMARDVSAVKTLAAELPPVFCDRVQLQQVLLNLIMNACDAMNANNAIPKQITISTAHRDGLARITISDTGCGLPGDAEGIFQPFVTTKDQGLGLGLAISRSIIESHCGRLWAEPLARGAAFHVELSGEVKTA